MEREVIRLLPYILGGMFALGVLLFLISLHQLRVRRTGAYWRLRRRAGDLGGKLFVVSIGLMTGAIALSAVTGLASLALRDVSDFLNRGPDDLYGIVLPPEAALTSTHEAVSAALTATRVRVETLVPPTASATNTPVPPTPTPVLPTATPTPTATATGTPTAVPPTLPPMLNLTAEFNVTPRPARSEFRLTLEAAAAEMTAADMAGGTTPTLAAQFTVGIKRVYLFISFENMDNGVAWSRVLLRDGIPVQGNTLLWSLGEFGSSYFFFGDEAGYEAGAYEVRLYVGSQEASRYTFTVGR